MKSEWSLKDNIKSGKVIFKSGDVVVIFRRKSNGYPASIKDGEDYIVNKVDRDFLIISKISSGKDGSVQSKRIHKTYFLPKYYLREIKLNSLLDETN